MTRSWKRLPTVLGFACAVAAATVAPAAAGVTAAHRDTAVHLDSRPTLGTDTAADPWSLATRIEEFENLTRRLPATRYPTTARLIFDTQNVYVFIQSNAARPSSPRKRPTTSASASTTFPASVSIRPGTAKFIISK